MDDDRLDQLEVGRAADVEGALWRSFQMVGAHNLPPTANLCVQQRFGGGIITGSDLLGRLLRGIAILEAENAAQQAAVP